MMDSHRLAIAGDWVSLVLRSPGVRQCVEVEGRRVKADCFEDPCWYLIVIIWSEQTNLSRTQSSVRERRTVGLHSHGVGKLCVETRHGWINHALGQQRLHISIVSPRAVAQKSADDGVGSSNCVVS
jgi:hypothetical protein